MQRRRHCNKAQAREGRGKNDSRRARRKDKSPWSLRRPGRKRSGVGAAKRVSAILRSDTGRNTIFTVDVGAWAQAK
jgi:ribosomal protein L25 (general stress protein Ctc)